MGRWDVLKFIKRPIQRCYQRLQWGHSAVPNVGAGASLFLENLRPCEHCQAQPEEEPEKGKPLFHDICGDTDFFDLCISSLETDNRSSKADYADLMPIVVDILIANLTGVHTYAQGILNETKDSQLSEALAACCKNYNSSVSDLQSVTVPEYFKSENYTPILDRVTWAKSNITECDEMLGKQKGHITLLPLASQNAIMHQLCDNAYVLISDAMV